MPHSASRYFSVSWLPKGQLHVTWSPRKHLAHRPGPRVVSLDAHLTQLLQKCPRSH